MTTQPPSSEWEKVTLEHCCFRPEYGYTASASEKLIGPKFLRITDIQNGRVDWDSVPYVERPDESDRSYFLEAGDIVIARIGATTGKAYLIQECPEAVFASYLIRVRTRPGLLPKFLNYCLQTSEYWQHINSQKGGRLKGGVNISILEKLEIPHPTPDEQAAVVQALDALQESSGARRRELALETERKAALMEYLFTKGTRGEQTKQTEIGRMPESWKLTTLGELCKDDRGLIQTGPFGSQLHASDYVQSGFPVVNPTHLLFNGIETDRLPKISKELADTLSRHYLFEGDILISRRGDFSRFAYIGSKQAGWLCGTGCLLVRLSNPAIDNYFLAISMSLEPIQNYLKQAAVGSIMPNLNTRILSQMPVILPCIEEQRRITEVVRSCEAKIRALEEEEPLRHELFNAMLEELMSGRLSAVPLIEEQKTQ
jgi:type I restriction enzyme S subunit